MSINEKTLKTFSGRNYPVGWEKLYNEPMGFWESIFFILKMSLWNITLKPSNNVSIWFFRFLNIITWFLFYALGQGTLFPLVIVGFFALIISVILFESTADMEHELILIWGAAVPLLLIISPLVAFIIMGGGNNRGLGKHSSYNDQTSIIPLNQIKTGRGYVKPK